MMKYVMPYQIKESFTLEEGDYELTDEEINDKWNALVIPCSKDDRLGYLVSLLTIVLQAI